MTCRNQYAHKDQAMYQTIVVEDFGFGLSIVPTFGANYHCYFAPGGTFDPRSEVDMGNDLLRKKTERPPERDVEAHEFSKLVETSSIEVSCATKDVG